MYVDLNYCIGKPVKYYDYLDMERFGKIVAIEPKSDDIAYVYIEDEDPEYNIHRDIVNNIPINYAEIRPSDSIYI